MGSTALTKRLMQSVDEIHKLLGDNVVKKRKVCAAKSLRV
jgi:hypothetical protein